MRRTRTFIRGLMLRIPILRQLILIHQEMHARRVTSSPQMEKLIREVWQKNEGKIATGPFKGMKYLQRTHGSMLLPKLLGTYEMELHSIVNQLIATQCSQIIDLGAAEGYYAVGFACCKPQATIIAYEASALARKHLRDLARLNKVADRVRAMGIATIKSLKCNIQPGCVVICDVEGAEVVLLDPVAIPSLRCSTILFEAHHLQESEEIINRFLVSHTIRKVTAKARSNIDWPSNVLLNSEYWPSDAASALNEFRGGFQEWYFLSPK